MSSSKLPDFSDYTSNRVFEGIRILSKEEGAAARARLKRAFDKLNKNIDNKL